MLFELKGSSVLYFAHLEEIITLLYKEKEFACKKCQKG